MPDCFTKFQKVLYYNVCTYSVLFFSVGPFMIIGGTICFPHRHLNFRLWEQLPLLALSFSSTTHDLALAN